MRGLYIHIPFCRKKCAYCDFVSFENSPHMDSYIDAVGKELELYAELFGREAPFEISSIYIGGGTPSLIDGIDRLLDKAMKLYNVRSNAEISIECNPESVTRKKLKSYHLCGINRLSIGLQSADDRLLCGIGRIHNRAQFETALNFALAAGFSNINVDIMYGLPGQDMDAFLDTVRYISALPITHISAYSLILEENTPLWRDYKAGKLTLPDEDITANMQDEAIKVLNSAGFSRYEVSNFSKPGFECVHNLTYWHNLEYLGVGVAAHSALKKGGWLRSCNTTNIDDYMSLIKKGIRPIIEESAIEKNEEMFECMMLGLRLVCGVDIKEFTKRFAISPMEAYGFKLATLIEKKLLTIDHGHIYATSRGFDILNSVICELL